MENRAELDRRNLLIRLTWLLLIGGCVVEFWLLDGFSASCGKLLTGKLKEFTAAIVPNLIAGLIGVLVVAWAARYLLKDSDREKYIAVLEPVRQGLREARAGNRIAPLDVQGVMRQVIPAVSLLYFSTKTPRVREEDKDTELTNANCNICSLECKMRQGACENCGDLFEAWNTAQKGS